MKLDQKNNDPEDPLIPTYVNGMIAIGCAMVLAILAMLGPLGFDIIHYRSSQSAIWQIAGNDLANLVLTIPILLIGGILELRHRPVAKYFLILAPISILYYAISIGLAQEWSAPNITGNVEQYFWLFLVLIIGGLFLLIGMVPRFSERDAPELNIKSLKAFVAMTSLFLVLFAMMWLSQVVQVIQAGDLPDGSYKAAPTLFWTIRYLDLGISIPLGFLSLFLFLTKPKKAYGLLLLFFGFMINTVTAVNAMSAVMFINNDPSADPMMAAIFLVLGAMSYALLYFMVKDKIGEWRSSRMLMKVSQG